MVISKKTLIVAVLTALLISSVSLVAAIPSIPHQFYGNVKVNGKTATSGIVTAKINGVQVESGNIVEGKYGYELLFLIEDPNNNREGSTIVFYVSGIEAGREIFHNGENTKLDLSIIVAQAYCGDGSCNSGETCSTCSADCGQCSPSGGTTGGGDTGGGNGNSRTTITQETCIEIWQCTEWTACIDGQQTRTCEDTAACGTTQLKPSTSRTCEETNETLTISQTRTGKPAGLTGAVIGALGAGGAIIVLFFILLIIILAILVFLARKKPLGKIKIRKVTVDK